MSHPHRRHDEPPPSRRRSTYSDPFSPRAERAFLIRLAVVLVMAAVLAVVEFVRRVVGD